MTDQPPHVHPVEEPAASQQPQPVQHPAPAQADESSRAAAEQPVQPRVDPLAEVHAQIARAEAELAGLDTQLADDHDPLAEVVAAKESELAATSEAAASVAQQLTAIRATAETMDTFIRRFGDVDGLEDRINKLEEEIASGNLSHIWNVSVQQDDLSRLDRNAVVAERFHERLDDIAKKEDILQSRINELLVKCEQRKNLATMEHDTTLAGIEKAHATELATLLDVRKKLKVLESEQQFHMRRGTYVKPAPVKHVRDFDFDRESDLQSQTCAEIVKERNNLEYFKEEVRGLRKQVTNARAEADGECVVIETQISQLRGTIEEVEWDRELLAVENEDLMSLKKEIITVTAAVKAQRKI